MSGMKAGRRGGYETMYGRARLSQRLQSARLLPREVRSARTISALLAGFLTAAMTVPLLAQAPAPGTAKAGVPAPGPGGPAATHAAAAAAASSGVVEITLERQQHDGTAESMAAGHVFAKGDVIRLRVTSHYDGFLYVMDQGTSGKFATVFPGAQTGSDNRVRMAQQYVVPADGWFEVDGPAGFDVLYFLLSPAALTTPSIASFAAPGPVSSLKPRCNDEIFRARGDCTDDSAGPTAVPQGQELPAPLAPIAGGASRDITFINKGNGTVGVQGEGRVPILYTFRLAHL